MTKASHPHPSMVATTACHEETGDCRCLARWMEAGNRPWTLVDRSVCEARYQAAARAVASDAVATWVV